MNSETNPKNDFYTDDLQAVIDSEIEYINKRRAKNNIQDTIEDSKDALGICFSGGGIRSATLCLGMMQKLIREKIFRRFDYLSTVSGGGYIGSCLTSLLTQDASGATDGTGVDPENSPFVDLEKIDESGKVVSYETGEDASLSVRHQIHHLRTHGEYILPRKDILSRGLQRVVGTLTTGIFHHLVLYTLLIIMATSLIHFLLILAAGSPLKMLDELNYDVKYRYIITDKTLSYLTIEGVPDDVVNKLKRYKDIEFSKGTDNFLETLGKSLNFDNSSKQQKLSHPLVSTEHQKSLLNHASNVEESSTEYLLNELKAWGYSRIGVPLYNMFYTGYPQIWKVHIFFILLGFITTLSFIYRANIIREKINKNAPNPTMDTKAGFNIEDHYEIKFIHGLNIYSVIVAVIATIIAALTYQWTHEDPYQLSVLFLPLSYAFGGKIISLLVVHAGLCFKSEDEVDRVHRSLYSAIQGATFYGIVLAIIVPVIIVFLFSLSYFSMKFWWTAITLLFSFLVLKQKTGQGGKFSKMMDTIRKPLLSLLVFLFLALSFDVVSKIITHHIYLDPVFRFLSPWFESVIAVVAFLIFSGLGIIVDSNRVSPHYFYRDRLTEAYLKTDARIRRAKDDKCKQQGMPLKNIRNHDDLKLMDIGENNNRGPYHIIVAALNLQGSKELNRKRMLSEHFIFSKNYVGSRVTGYVKTSAYRDGETKLARAMTISAAAAGSAMGFHSFGAQAFAATLFNIRLGYWMANPWAYCNKIKVNPEKKPIYWRMWDTDHWSYVRKRGSKTETEPIYWPTWIVNLWCCLTKKTNKRVKKPIHWPTYWPMWLGYELFDLCDARKRLVNVSDGGHTGDNLGFLPLLQRRVKLIVICDGEDDGNYSFTSFNNVVRMAYIEENIKIDIDLSKIVPEKNKDGTYQLSKSSVAIGTIKYPPHKGNDVEYDEEKDGRLIYLKSSLSEPEIVLEKEKYGKNVKRKYKLPVHVKNYQKDNADFPHQTTADQFFDDAQFEAYRALGDHIAGEAIERNILNS